MPGNRKKRRKKQTHSVLLLKDNAAAHKSQVAMTAASECRFEMLPHTPYVPEMAPSDFYLFPKLKFHLRGAQYGSNKGAIEAVNEYVIYVLFLLCFRARLFIDALWLPAGKGLTSWLSFVMSNCEVVTFPFVSWVRCSA